MSSPKHSDLINQVEQLLKIENLAVLDGLKSVCELLNKEIEYFDWVGFYFSDFDTKMLHLKAFTGAPTEHTSIPFGKGICGQVALSNKNFVVPDITQQDNYIACSIDVRSELVVPLFLEGKNIGQIDIDSKTPNPFSKDDEELCSSVCNLISRTYGNLLNQL
ncbi:GAF domain-containing protein [Flavobacteriaceae bacterium]|nr:GAF domain-containing protein [Flavobacteriaceae bacterium]